MTSHLCVASCLHVPSYNDLNCSRAGLDSFREQIIAHLRFKSTTYNRLKCTFHLKFTNLDRFLLNRPRVSWPRNFICFESEKSSHFQSHSRLCLSLSVCRLAHFWRNRNIRYKTLTSSFISSLSHSVSLSHTHFFYLSSSHTNSRDLIHLPIILSLPFSLYKLSRIRCTIRVWLSHSTKS